LHIVSYWLGTYQLPLTDACRTAALQFALERGSRSGRVAWQFAKDWAGKQTSST
jgi:predicted AAA+ superfamily ATPase